MSVAVREATADDSLGVRRVLDAAMLEVREDLDARIAAGDVLVAEDGKSGQQKTTILGALVLIPREIVHESACAGSADAAHAEATRPDAERADATRTDAMRVDAVAVRRARRGRGIGSALVREAAERHHRLTAAFDPKVRPFYEALGFEIAPVAGEDDRLRGVFEAED